IPCKASSETRALQTVVDVFHQYSIRQGEIDLLSLGDFRTLLTEQAPSFLGSCNRNQAGYLEKLFQETDLNKDKELSFEEFTIVLTWARKPAPVPGTP
uniref:EF-hand domain-containing protein n=1 Tax=Cyanistes caeruleus TaxID=156563 RepID=A0A8C0U0A4_CYACU